MASCDIRPPPRSRLSVLFSSAGIPLMPNEFNEESGSPRTRSHNRTTASYNPSPESPPASVDQSDKPPRPNRSKARKLSRVFADFSLLDPFTARKSIDDFRATLRKPKSTPIRPATSHGHTRNHSLGGSSMHSLDGKPRPTSPTSPPPSSVAPVSASTTPISKSKTSIAKAPQSPITLDTSLTPQVKPPIPPPPENIRLPPSRHGSSRGPMLVKKRGQSLDLNQLAEVGAKAPLAERSRSLRITPISNLSRPTTPKSPTPVPDLSPDTRDPPAPPEAARQHFLEVKRARKMTQLFGQELPPELIRVLDDRRKAEHTRRRAGSTASSTIDSVPSTPMVEGFTNAAEEETLVPTSPPTKPRTDFQERRRRVAKLSQFFGVNHAEIASSVVFTKPDRQHTTSIDEEMQKPISVTHGEPVEVGVKVVSRRRWGLGEDMRDVELSDAISKLRCLKAN